VTVESTRQEGVGAQLLRQTIGGFATGVAVVTTEDDGALHGMTVNSLTSLSLEPPLLLVCLTKGSRTSAAVEHRGAFVVNLLSERQEALSNRFARRGEDHFEGLTLEWTESGLPVLPKGVGRLECEVDRILPGGDHTIVIGRVVGCEPREGAPLAFYRGRYHRIQGDGHAAPWIW
jgi:flavin reductase (DIM6/NTAB) family NADH-FMN oxidoreductase RutF